MPLGIKRKLYDAAERVRYRKVQGVLVPEDWLKPAVLSPQVGTVPILKPVQESQTPILPGIPEEDKMIQTRAPEMADPAPPGVSTDSKQIWQAPKGYKVLEREKQPRVWRVPGLRTGKRIIACLLIVVNFLISQITWTSMPQTQFFAIFFLANSFVLADYVWKTRKRTL